MKYSTMAIGITLSLASSACTGFGVQTGPTLSSQIVEEQVLGSLWGEEESGLPNGLVTLGADHEHDQTDLWIEGARSQSDWNGYGEPGEAAPRAERVLERLTLQDSVFASDSFSGDVLPK